MDFNFNEDQKLRRYIMEEFSSEDWQQAYDFLKAGERTGNDKPRVINIDNGERYPDGIYICYKDGYKALFDGQNSKDGVSHIGIVMGSKMLGVTLDTRGEHRLPHLDDENEFNGYIDNRTDAVADYTGKEKTERFRKSGKLDFALSDTEWLPSVGELYLIFINKKLVNEALDYVGGDTIHGYYWSVAEASATFAWFIDFGSGHLGNTGFKPYTNSVRAVCAF